MIRIVTLCCALLFALTASAQKYDSKKLDEQIEKIAKGINKSCPKLVDSITRMDSTASLGNVTFGYFYTLITVDADDIDTEVVEKGMKENLVKVVKATDSMVPLNNFGTTLVYSYVDKNGKKIAYIVIKPEEYKR